MGGPAWLTDIFAAVMITVAAYCASRLVVARWWRRPTDVDTDGVHVVMGVAMAGMLVAGLRFGSFGLWEAVFAAAAGWFGWRFVRVRRGAPLSPWRCPQPVPHLVECGAMLYMYLAVPAVAAAAKGAPGAMGGMSATGARFSVLALALALFMFGYVAWVGDRLTARAPALAVAVPAVAVPAAAVPPVLQESGALTRPPSGLRPPQRRPRARLARRLRRFRPGPSVPSPPVRRHVQDRHGDHHGLRADPDAVVALHVVHAPRTSVHQPAITPTASCRPYDRQLAVGISQDSVSASSDTAVRGSRSRIRARDYIASLPAVTPRPSITAHADRVRTAPTPDDAPT